MPARRPKLSRRAWVARSTNPVRPHRWIFMQHFFFRCSKIRRDAIIFSTVATKTKFVAKKYLRDRRKKMNLMMRGSKSQTPVVTNIYVNVYATILVND